MRCYIAGRMRGIKWYNFPAFDKARENLIKMGFEVISPADLDRKNGFDALNLPEDYDWNSIPDLGDRIRSLDCPWIHGSDAVETIAPGDKRFDITEFAKTVMEQIEDAADMLKPLRKKCIGMIKGNHESKMSAVVGDITEHICKMADLENLSQTCVIELFAPHGRSDVFASHYINSITNRNEDSLVREAGRASRLRKLARKFDFHLKLFAHIHKFICHPAVKEDRLMLIDGQLKHRPASVFGCWCVVCPAFLKVYDKDNYAQARLMEPVDIGWVEIDYNNEAKIVEVRNMLGDGTVKRRYHEVLCD